jgi:hypothetical protein
MGWARLGFWIVSQQSFSPVPLPFLSFLPFLSLELYHSTAPAPSHGKAFFCLITYRHKTRSWFAYDFLLSAQSPAILELSTLTIVRHRHVTVWSDGQDRDIADGETLALVCKSDGTSDYDHQLHRTIYVLRTTSWAGIEANTRSISDEPAVGELPPGSCSSKLLYLTHQISRGKPV